MRRIGPALLAIVAGCTSGSGALVLIDLTATDKVEQFDLYVRDDATGTIVLHTGWTDATAGGTRDPSVTPVRIALEPPAPGSYSIVAVGAIGGVDGNRPRPGAKQFFWATTVNVDGEAMVAGQLLPVPAGDDMDGDLFPDAVVWPTHVAAAQSIPPSLLDCDDKTDYPMKKIFAAMINPFAPEICGDGVDEDCNGPGDETCVDADGDGDPDSSDCKPMDPKIHHPITDPKSPHYDPYPQSANCCGYNLGKTGADANKSFATDPICHAASCDDAVDEDCSGKDVACVADQDCDQFRAKAMEDNACKAPADKDQASPNLDCDDCNPAINPNAPEICDGLDNNCNGLVDETCVTCDLDGDGFQRLDAQNGCPDAKYVQSGKPIDCNDEDAGVFPGSTSAMYPVKLNGQLASCNDTDGGTLCGAMRGLCRNVGPDGMPQDSACSGMLRRSCPPANCDADGDGYIDSAKSVQCDPQGKLLPYDCNDADPTVFPGAPGKCGETSAHNCAAIIQCGTDADGDLYDSTADCDDADPNVHPWATELCDGKDNDCDGLTDEGNPDETGAPMVSMGHVAYCTDSDVGACAQAPIGHCVCSASPVASLHFEPAKRTACPGETPAIDAGSGSKARCYGARQPGRQSCNPMMPLDDDCDGRVDAPDGKNFPQVGMPCWPAAVGQCAPARGGKITACDMTKTNCFAAAGVNPWLVCDNSAICPVAEKCNGLDDDCNGNVPVNETDGDGDGYVACGSPFPVYTSGQVCEMMLGNGIVGCGDCADSVGFTMGINNNQIHPGQADICDGVDNDCNPPTGDGNADCPGPKPALICCGQNGCKDPANDLNNCNGCGMVCVEANAIPQCTAAACGVKSCTVPFANCDNQAANGCEVNTNTDPTHCGGCANNCSANNIATPTCSGGLCNGNCNANFLDCDGNKLTNGCEANTQTDPTHCGGCANNCSANNIAPACSGGVCTGVCNAGFLDCDGNKTTNGCEINGQTDASHCGACANACSNNNIAAPTCGGGICNGNCNGGFGDCDGNKLINGCEINLFTDTLHCGSCANACSNNNIAAPTCGGGVCNGACNAGFADCDGNKLGNGCEVNLNTTATHCGACANNCSANNMATVTCGGGLCNGSCSAGFFDCNGNKLTDGCELDGRSDVFNCGGCGTVCSTTNVARACAAGSCNTGVCNAGFFDCDANKQVDGCELDGRSDPFNCGGCNKVCSGNNMMTVTCSAQVCNGNCNAGFGDCNGNKLTDGCETNLTTVANCGSCGNDCSTKANGHLCISLACGCSSDNDCGAGKPRCNVGTHLCQACLTDNDCSPANPVCTAGLCGACTGGMASTCTNGGWGNACGPPCTCNSNPDCTNPRVDTCSGNTCICQKTGTVCPVGKQCSGAGCI